MIPQITEINFPAYATLNSASVTLAEMGDRTISTQIKIDGDIVPDFSNWALEFKGERFILPTKEPQAAKENSSRRSIVDLTFTSWPVNELKRYFFVEMTSISAGTAIADKYKASLGLNIENFVVAFNKVLNYYFNGTIIMDLYGAGTGIYSTEPSFIEIDNTYIWEVLQKVYEIYEVRWVITYDSTNQRYVIKVGYPAAEIDDHNFEYGYQGGLLRFERQVQDYDITNILLGRGGEKNLPYRYFKKVDPNNPEWAADPDAIPELKNIYFENLRDINFRRYVQGWKTNPNRTLEEGDVLETYDAERGAIDFAYAKGHTDEKFNPVEYVKDDASIALYGEHWGALDDNEDIYPTIQGIEVSPYGRIDQVVDVEPVSTDDIEAMAEDAAEITNIPGSEQSIWLDANSTETIEVRGGDFTIPTGKVGNLTVRSSALGGWFSTVVYGKKNNKQTNVDPSDPVNPLVSINTTQSYIIAVDKSTGNEIPVSGMPAGSYYYKLHIVIKGEFETAMYDSVSVTAGVGGLKLTVSDGTADAWKPTFDIWVKNIWNTTQGNSESDLAYATRVWEPILGDRVGNEASISFSTGFLSISQDYNFKIASYPVVDRSKTIGGVTSEWRITLIKSDAEYEATGKYIPNADTGGNAAAGDYFFFTGIDMPHAYVLWAEEKLNAHKTTELAKVKQINPTWLIHIDKVRANTKEQGELEFLADRFAAGAKLRVRDKRFTNNNVLTLYVQTITYTWQEPKAGSPYLVPDIEVVLSDKVVTSESPIDRLEGDVDVIQSSYAKISDIESAIRRVASPLFLKKTGESERSMSPTRFSSLVAAEDFRQGDIGGQGWGAYTDGDGHSVLEADVFVVRKNMRVSSLVVNQVAYMGGKQIISAAAMECSKVVTDSNGDYICYFDQKQGSVGNLFLVGDIAMGQVWDAENNQIRYYKRKVLAVGTDYITLSSSIADGTDVPQAGDVLVQYGSYTNTARQFVIIRDVIGGGYERMLSGLSTVSATGNEYYFAGRQSGSTERWFVGNVNGQNASYQNGVLNITGRLSVSTQIDKGNGNYEALSTYLNNLQDQIDGTVQTWYASGVPTLNNYPASSWPTVEDKNNHIGDLYYDKDTGKAYRFMYDGDNEVYVWAQIADEDIAAALALAQQNQTAIAGLQYLKAATNQGTLVQGGLVLTSMIQLGRTEQSVYKVYSGINGIMDNTATGGGIAAWYGGEMLEKTDWDAMSAADQAQHTYAKSLFRFDGSGYLASNNIRWDANGNGQIPGISWQNGRITLSSDIYLTGGDQLTAVIDAVNHMYTQFRYDSTHGIVSVVVSDALYIPTSSPEYPIAGKYALYADLDGYYSQIPSGGGVGETLTLRVNGTKLFDYNGSEAVSENITIPTTLAALSGDTTHRTVTDAQITTWNGKQDTISDLSTIRTQAGNGNTAYGWGDHSQAGYALASNLGTAAGKNFTTSVTQYSGDLVTSGAVYAALSSYSTTARSLSDADDLLFKDSDDEGTDVTIDVETGVTGTVLWGAESANQVALSVNGASKLLLKAAALNGINSSITTILGYFSGGSAYNALALEGHNASYFAAASSVPTNVSQLINDSGYITNSTSNLANYYLKTETYTKTEVENLISSGAYTLPTASSTTKGGIKVGNTLSISNEVLNVLAGNIASNNTGYVTGGDIYSYINAIMSSSMKNIGVSSTAITNGGSETPTINGSPYTPNVNDVVFYDSKEFVWTASGTWRELGDESSFALKTTSISAGTGLTGGGTLSENRTISLSSATITSLGKADTALQSADMKALTLVVGSTTIGNDYNALAAKTYTISKSNLTTTLESDSGYYVKKAGDTMTGTLNSQSVIPTTTNTYSLGSSSLKYLDAYATTFYGALSGNASTATKLATARTLWGQSFDGSANVSGSLTDVTDITATGFAQLPSIYAATSLAIPTSAPSSSASWYSSSRYYLYADSNGNYSETPSGGGGGVGETLTLRVNGSKLFDYNGSEAVSENITVPTTLADLSSDSTHRTVSDTQISNWNTAYGWGNHANAGYLTSVAFSDLTSHPTTISGYGITDAKIETPSGTSNKKITLGSDELLLYAWALASAKPTYNKADVGLGNVENTALSTWAGTTNITTLGTVTTGTWNGTAIANDKLALDMSWAFVSNTASYDTTDLIVIN